MDEINLAFLSALAIIAGVARSAGQSAFSAITLKTIARASHAPRALPVLAVALSLVFLVAFTPIAVYALDPGHDPSEIGPGTFNAGNYTFPGNLNVTGNVTVNGSVGIGTANPQGALEIGSGQLLLPNGSAEAPSMSFSGHPTTGFYDLGYANAIAFAANGAYRGSISAAGLEFNGPFIYMTSPSPTLAFGPSADTGISRGGANKIYIGNGTYGDYSGTLISGNVGINTTNPSALLTVGNNDQFTVNNNGDVAVWQGGTIMVNSYNTGIRENYLQLFGGNGGIIAATSEGNISIGHLVSNIPAYTMAILNNGNVGINTTSPNYTLDVNGDINIPNGKALYTQTNKAMMQDGADFKFGWIDNALYYKTHMGSPTDYYLSLVGNGQDRLFVNGSSGNVGIGTDNPSQLLTVGNNSDRMTVDGSGNIIAHSFTVPSYNSILASNKLVLYGTNGGIISSDDNGSISIGHMVSDVPNYSLYVNSSGNVGIGTTNPNSSLDIYNGAIELSGSGSFVPDKARIYGSSGTLQLTGTDVYIANGFGAQLIEVTNSNTVLLAPTSGGSIGINTTMPNATLDVNGNISAQVLCLNGNCQNSWSTANFSGEGVNSTRIGEGSIAPNLDNTAIGAYANTSGGQDETAIGSHAQAVNDNTNTAIGAYAEARGVSDVAIGGWATTSAGGPGGAVAIGRSSHAGWGSTAIGWSANASGSASLAIGNGAYTSPQGYQIAIMGSTATDSIAIGYASTVNNYENSIVLGGFSTATGSNQFVMGANRNGFTGIQDVYIGRGIINSEPLTTTYHATSGNGTDVAGGSIDLAAGQGTGSAHGGDIIFQTSDAGSSGDSLNPLSTRMVINSSGSVGIGTTSPASALDVNGTITAGDIVGSISGQKIGLSRYPGYIDFVPVAGGPFLSITKANAFGTGDLVFQGQGGNTIFESYDNPLYFTTGGTLSPDIHLAPNRTVALTVTGGGNVGIGTTTPNFKTEINAGESQNVLWVGSSNSNAVGLSFSNNNTYGKEVIALTETNSSSGATPFYIQRYNTGAVGTPGKVEFVQGLDAPLTLATNAQDRVTILGNGNVGINATMPNATLDVNGNISTSTLCLNGDCQSAWSIDSSGGAWTNDSTTVTTNLNANLTAGNLTIINGNVGIGISNPTYKLDIDTGNTSTFKDIIHINATTGSQQRSFLISNTGDDGGGNWQMGASANSRYILKGYSIDLSPYDAGQGGSYQTRVYGDLLVNTNQMVINSTTGNVGIGTPSSNAKLEVSNSGTEDIFRASDNGANVFKIIDGGWVGFGPNGNAYAAPGRFVSIGGGYDTTLGHGYGLMVGVDDNPSDNSSNNAYAGYFTAATTEGNNHNSNYVVGIQGRAIHRSNGTLALAQGMSFETVNAGNATISSGSGLSASVYNSNNGRISEAVGIGLTINNNTGSIPVAYGIKFSGITADIGSTAYGIYMPAWNSGTKYGIYDMGNTQYFGGSVGIGTNSPGAKLEVNGTGNITNPLEAIRITNSNDSTYTRMYDDLTAFHLEKVGSGVRNLYMTDGWLAVSLPGMVNFYSNGGLDYNYGEGNRVNFYHGGSMNMWADEGVVKTGFWNGSSGALSVGYASPGTAMLAVNGNVGIGTQTPISTLDVVGNTTFSLPSNGVGLLVKVNSTQNNDILRVVDSSGNYIMNMNNESRLNIGDIYGGQYDSSRLHIIERPTDGQGLHIEGNIPGFQGVTFRMSNDAGNTSEPGGNTFVLYSGDFSGSLQAYHGASAESGVIQYGTYNDNSTMTLYAGNGGFGSATVNLDSSSSYGGRIRFLTQGDSEKMRLSTEGRLGIGTMYPSEKLTVNGSLRVENPMGSPVFFVNSSDGSMSITQNGGVAGIDELSIQHDGTGAVFTNHDNDTTTTHSNFVFTGPKTGGGTASMSFDSSGQIVSNYGSIRFDPVGGGSVLSVSPGTMGIANNSQVKWSVDQNPAGGLAYDTGLARETPGVVKVTNGTTGTGTLVAANVSASVVCLNGDCQTSWPSGSGSSAWTNDSTTATTGLNVNVTDGNLTVINGNVGIGTATPGSKLTVSGGSIWTDNIVYASGGNTFLTSGGTGARGDFVFNMGNFGTVDAPLALYANNTEVIRLASSGNVGIGNSTPASTLMVNGTFSVMNGSGTQGLYQDANGFVGIGTASPNNPLEIRDGNGDYHLRLTYNDTRYTNIYQSGSGDGLVFNPNTDLASTTVLYTASKPAGVIQLKVEESSNGIRTMIESSAAGYGWMGTASNHSLYIGTNDNGRVLIDTSGNVGIGTTSPGAKLDINATGLAVQVGTADAATYMSFANRAYVGYGGDNLILQGRGGKGIIFNVENDNFGTDSGVGNGEAMRIDTSRKVGIGTANPSEKLDINGSMQVTGPAGDVRFFVNATTGKVGVNTNQPSDQFSVDGVILGNQGTYSATEVGLAVGDSQYGLSSNSGKLYIHSPDGGFGFNTNSKEVVSVSGAGDVGVGIASPDSKLHVNGTVTIGTPTLPRGITLYNESGDAYCIQMQGTSLVATMGNCAS